MLARDIVSVDDFLSHHTILPVRRIIIKMAKSYTVHDILYMIYK